MFRSIQELPLLHPKGQGGILRNNTSAPQVGHDLCATIFGWAV